MKSIHQTYVEEYHREILTNHGCDMYRWHGRWHVQHESPRPPEPMPQSDWGENNDFGYQFLQMHHEMVQASSAEPKYFMQHPSLKEWYQSKGYPLPAAWAPPDPIPEGLGYEPDPFVFHQNVQDCLNSRLAGSGFSSVNAMLTRFPNANQFSLPAYFSAQGAAPADPGDPYTGARRLQDFLNVNQLGCSMADPHGEWHGFIGGAMANMYTALADPIFYWGVHLIIDNIYVEFLALMEQRKKSGATRADTLAQRSQHRGSAVQQRKLIEAHELRRSRVAKLVEECPDIMNGFRPCHTGMSGMRTHHMEPVKPSGVDSARE